MGNATGRDEAWIQLVKDIIGSWLLVFRTAALVLACSPVVILVILLLLALR